MQKEWEPIISYEGLYEINGIGECKSLGKSWKIKEGHVVNAKTRILKGGRNNKYVVYTLYKNRIGVRFFAHRLVASAFIPNPDNKKFVNHKNGNRSDNRIDNLEWCTSSENELHSYRVLGKTHSTTWKENFPKKMRKVMCINTNKIFNSITEAAEIMHLHRRCVNRVAAGERKHTQGYNFKFIN